MSKPTNFSISESLEVVWEAVHQWSADIQEHRDEHEPTEDDVKLAMHWIMDELNYTFDEAGVIIPKL